jgi:hypothetical protein
VNSHLKDWHVSIEPKERKKIAAQVGLIPDIIQDQAGLAQFKFPAPMTEPIPFITPAIGGERWVAM